MRGALRVIRHSVSAYRITAMRIGIAAKQEFTFIAESPSEMQGIWEMQSGLRGLRPGAPLAFSIVYRRGKVNEGIPRRPP